MKQALIKRCSFILFALTSMITYAQTASSQIKITGTVTDNTGLLLPGVNVTEKSTKNTVSTDYSGRYEISVKPGATLVFSFIGMKKAEIPLNGRTNLDAKMQEDSNVLDDIVVVAYGTQKKKNLTGAIATIKPQELENLPVTNLSDALRGLVPGLNVTSASGRPGDSGTISIRQTFGFSKDGNSTIPLIVIDDMVQIDPLNGKATLDAFNRLDPTEIESITVLKDASAAIYGSRASQGAVIVKTKRGKAGKPKFSYVSQFAINDAVSHTKTMSAYEYGVFANRYYTGGLLPTATFDPAKTFSANELEEMKGLNYDWLKKAWKPAIQQKHSFNVSGGTEGITYFAGATFLSQDANMGPQKYEKWNYRTGINAKIASNLDFSAAISGTSGFVDKAFTKASANITDGSYGSGSSGEQADYGYLVHMPKYIPWETTIGGINYYTSPFNRPDKNMGTSNSRTSLAGWNYFANLNNGSHQITDDSSMNVNASLTYKLAAVKGLSFKGAFARTQSSSYNEQIQLPYDLARIRNYETQDNKLASEANPTVYNAAANPSGDYLIETNVQNSRVAYNSNFSKSTQLNFFANYDRTFGNHQVSAMFGVEKSEYENKKVTLLYVNTPKDYLGDYRTAGTVDTGNSQTGRVEGGTLSYFGNVNYNYKSKYLAQFLFRSDASTKFAPEHYWGYFPSLQLGWVVSKENWFENFAPVVNNFKFRYSIGKTGKDNLQAWKWYQYYSIIVNKGSTFGPGGGQLGPGLTPEVNPNRDAAWDTTLKNNLGIDLAFLQNRLQFTADFYYETTKNMLTDMGSATGVPISIGGAFAEQNYAAVKAWGSELSIDWNDQIKGGISYNIGMNFGYGDNEITRYPDQGNLLPSNNNRREGNSEGYNPIWGFHTWKGTSTGDGILRTDADIAAYWNYLTEHANAVGGAPSYFNIIDPSKILKGSLAYQDVAGQLNTDGTVAPADGKIEKENDYVKLANSSRVYSITSNLGMKYKGFSFRTQIATSWGGATFVDLVGMGNSASSIWARETFWNDMYAADNPNGKYPNIAGTEVLNKSDFWQVNTFRCYIQNLTMAYEIPKQAFANTKVQNISLGITGNNLWDLYNPYPGKYRNMYDTSSGGYPTLRTWTVNLNISF